MSDDRVKLTVLKITRAKRAQMDIEKLWLQPEFKRFLFTLLERAHIFSGIYGTDGRYLHFGEGRRSLGYDILRTVEQCSPDALALILAEEVKSQKEAPNAKPQFDRLRELRTDDDPLGFGSYAPPGTGLYLYGADPDAE